MPAIFPADAPPVLIAALSARALAASARSAGYIPLVADLFDDLDTRDLAARSRRVRGSLARGIGKTSLLHALDRLSDGYDPIGVVYGGGFEDRPQLLQSIAERHRLIGNPVDVVSRVKDPTRLAGVCERNCIPHPGPTSNPGAEGEWLRKRAGASGGGHVVAATSQARRGRRHYYQRHVAGVAVSAAFLADGSASRLLGFSRQWSDPAPGSPFRYGGAARPAFLAPALASGMADAVARLVADTGLRGLNSADFIVRPDGFDLLEINPRPGATLDIFRDECKGIFHLHVEACAGRLPVAAPLLAGSNAAAVVYARRPVTLPAGFGWPEWTADRQRPGQLVPAGAPICTVLAAAADTDAAECLARTRGEQILELAEESS